MFQIIEKQALKLALLMAGYADYVFDINEDEDLKNDFLLDNEDFLKEEEISKIEFDFVASRFLGWDRLDIQEYICEVILNQ